MIMMEGRGISRPWGWQTQASWHVELASVPDAELLIRHFEAHFGTIEWKNLLHF